MINKMGAKERRKWLERRSGHLERWLLLNCPFYIERRAQRLANFTLYFIPMSEPIHQPTDD